MKPLPNGAARTGRREQPERHREGGGRSSTIIPEDTTYQERKSMQYSEGQVGRVFTVRIDDGEDFIREIRRFVTAMNISSGMIHFLGATRSAKIVTGPKELTVPPSPRGEEIFGGWELLGFATIYPGEEGPSIHIHTAAGKGIRSLAGCLREKAEVYIVVEAIITEFVGVSAKRTLDEKTGVDLPVFDRILP
jgi:hypothetical protein